MKLRTEIEALKCAGEMDYGFSAVMIGSCFVDEVGAKLRRCLFDVDVNPFGTLFNPESMALEVEAAIDGTRFEADDLFEENGQWRSFRRHSSFSSSNKDEMLAALNAALTRIQKRLETVDFLILTFGSAIAFRHNDSEKIVANCHKQTSDCFSRITISAGEITSRWTTLIERLHQINPKLRIILTVSPVRHIGYGLEADRLSKSTLIVACHELAANKVNNAVYFPAYEAVVDDLRDYRFYARDLVHPSELAVEYVFDLFQHSFMTPSTIDYSRRWQKLTSRLFHRSTVPNPDFASETLRLAENLASDQRTVNPQTLISRFSELAATLQ